MLDFSVSLPPTSNHRLTLGRSGRRLIKSSKYRQWIEQAAFEIKATIGQQNQINSACFVLVFVTFPDKRKRDLDNVLKSLNDAMVYGGALTDDHLIQGQLVIRRPVDKTHCGVSVQIWPLDADLPQNFKELLCL